MNIAVGHLDFSNTQITESARVANPFGAASGDASLYDEFLNLTTERAKTMNKQIRNRFGDAGEVDGHAAIFTGIVQSMINWGNDPHVGAEVATIILEKGHNVRWYARPDFCPDKKRNAN